MIYENLYVPYVWVCLKVKRMNGKFTSIGLKVVLSVDGSMRHYSYIAQSISYGYLRLKLKVMKLLYVDYVLI